MSRRLPLLATAVLLATSACGGSGDAAGSHSATPSSSASSSASGTASASPTPSPTPTPAPVAWRAPLQAIGQPKAVGGAAVVYERRGQRLWLSAFDPGSGRRLWSKEATPSLTTPGVPTTVEAVGPSSRELVVLLARHPDAEPLRADLLVVAPRSGKVVRRHDDAQFDSQPARCPDSGAAVCVDLHSPVRGSIAMSLDLRSGAFRRVTGVPAGWTPRPLGSHGLVDAGVRPPKGPEVLARLSRGRVLWKHPVADLFGRGATSDNGWSFDYDARSGVFVGSLGTAYRGTTTNRTLDLSRDRTVGIDARTGRVLWSVPRTSSFCSLDTDLDDTGVFVRCRQSGRLTVSADAKGDYHSRYRNVRLVLQGFDLRTGRTTWSVPIARGDHRLLGQDGTRIPRASATQALLSTPRGPRVVEADTGATREVVPGETFVCTSSASYPYAEPIYFGTRAVYRRQGGLLDQPCNARGRPTGSPLTADLTQVNGAVAGGVAVVALHRGLVAYRVP